MKVRLTERGKKVADECEIPRRVRTKFDAVMEDKDRNDLMIKSSDGKKCMNCDIVNHPDSCIGCKYDW